MKTITDLFEPYIGTVEYNGIIADIQRWFYNTKDVVHASWCATSVSFFADKAGVLDQLGGKNENVFRMMIAAEKANAALHKGAFRYRKSLSEGETIKRGTVIFMLRSSSPMTETSSKHVTTAYQDFTFTGKGTFKALGGNQSDSIRVSEYSQTTIYAVFAPDYDTEKVEHPTLRKGDKGADVKKMQSDLRKIGFARVSGEEMVADGSFGRITAATVIAFQVLTGIKADAICGPITWGKIDDLLAMPKEKTEALTDVYYRVGPGKGYTALGVIKEGTKATFTSIVDGWLYFPSLKGWSRSSYFYL